MTKEQGYFGRLASSMKRGLAVATIAGAGILSACGGGGGGGTTPEPPTPVNRGVLASQLGSLETILANPEVNGLINNTGINYPTNDPSLAPNIRGNWDGSSYDLSVGKQYHNRAPGVVLNGQNIGQVYMRGNDDGNGNGDWTAVYVTEQNVGDANNDGNPDLETKVHFLQGTKSGNSSSFRKGSVLVGMHGNDTRAESELGNTQYNTDNLVRTFLPEQVVKLSEGNGGGIHAVMITGAGRVLGNGDNFFNALGNLNTGLHLTPKGIPELEGAVQVTADSRSTYMIDDLGNAYEMGTLAKDPVPRLLTFPNGAKPLRIISKGLTTIALMDDGTVTGMAEGGSPSTIPGLSGIEKISMTGSHLLTANSVGQVVRTDLNDPDQKETLTGIPTNIKELSAAGTAYSVLTSDGRVFVTLNTQTNATEVDFPGLIEEIDWGGQIVRNSAGQVYIAGLSILPPTITESPLSQRGIRELNAEEAYRRALDKYGNVFGFGFNDVGQLGNGTLIDADENNPTEANLAEIE